MFSNMHNSMAPPQVRRNSSDLLSSSPENLAPASPSTKHRALLPPSYQGSVSSADQVETHNPLPKRDSGRRSMQKNKEPVLPLPDYDTLYPKRIHGVQGQMKWDHIVAEVTQRHREYPPELIGKEMCVDRPSNRQDEPVPIPRDTATIPGKTTEEDPSYSWKRMGSGTKHSFTTPKRNPAAPERSSSNVGTKPGPSARQLNDLFASKGLGAATPKVQNGSVPQAKPRSSLRDEKKVLNTSVNIDGGRDAPQENPDNHAKAVPSITPRQSKKEKLENSNSAVDGGIFENPSELFPAKGKADDPFPSEVILTKDPWAVPVQSFEGDDLFTGGPKKEVKPDEAGMTTDDMEKLFGQKDKGDPFSYFEAKSPVQDKRKENSSAKFSPGVHRAFSSKRNPAALPPPKPARSAEVVDPFSSSLVSPEPVKTAGGDVAPQSTGTSGGKNPLRAWVSPSEAVQGSGGGGMAVGKAGEPAPTPRRPHPVKPMNSLENQTPTNISLGRNGKSPVIHEGVPVKIKVSGSVDTKPYSQLTPDELISLVVKQQDEISKKDEKILELEDYIDNLLVHVIEEKPSILLTMANAKKAV